MDLRFLLAGGFVPTLVKYGYLATFVGTLLEGETFLILSGLAASRGYLEVSVLYLIGAGGAFLTDNFFFALGRAVGPAILTRFPRLASSVGRAHALVERLPNTAVIGVRFIYGMRTVGPAVIGTGNIAWLRFAILDALAASLWSFFWISAAYLLGEAGAKLVEEFAQIGPWLFAGAVAGIVIAVLIFLHRRGAPKTAKTPGRTN